MRIRNKNQGFVGLQLTPELLDKLEAEMLATTLNRSQIIRLAIINYLGLSKKVEPPKKRTRTTKKS